MQTSERATLAVALAVAALLGTACTSRELGGNPQSPAASVAPSFSAPSGTLSGETLWAQLRDGVGIVVMLRHTSTEPGTGDPPGFVLTDCATQRNLSPAGRDEARMLGAVFRARTVPVQQVSSSRYCRCLETAQLLGLGPVTPQPVLDSLFTDRPETEQRTAQLRVVIAAHRAQPGVLLLVTHQTNIAAASGISPQPGEAVVLRADDTNQIAVIGVLPAP